ncbi:MULTISPECIES: hypothetical protein [unclassified Pseudofrankia]|uniref:hypothetical protein n=1 Tax=unclassified Pseudofrankia TaxID=2994372 RepID=UPI000E2A3DD2|nr:hypothetical protein [Pseudofrankia sp. BMG5.36]MDT3441460.1 hypothetical protein [Pseudofrankia sp. BMG5.37]
MAQHHVVFDDSAMLAAGRGNIVASTLIHNAHNLPGWHLYAPTCALVEADRVRRGIAEHIASLRDIVILDLTFSAALAVARDTSWATAHTRHAAGPSPERPVGAKIATADPARWKGQPFEVIDLTAA